jgi:hypothetical protein
MTIRKNRNNIYVFDALNKQSNQTKKCRISKNRYCKTISFSESNDYWIVNFEQNNTYDIATKITLMGNLNFDNSKSLSIENIKLS